MDRWHRRRRPDPTQPFYAIPVKAELRDILAQAETICRAAGTSLKNAVRIQQFHAGLADLPATLEVWSEAMDGMPLPLSPIEVPWLPVPDARLQLDLWVYVPRPGCSECTYQRSQRARGGE